MAVTILDGSMSSDRTTHRARLIPGRAHLWEVSWLPGHRLDRNRATTATDSPPMHGGMRRSFVRK